ncbi:ADP-ribosylglycohydrolase family protein [Umezawaea sp. NPDC059074]|uniref:ADP-ribosylglycohydrolase family protein n=1 Tax=Umezawaea sp. NPDC059074 TaxID=3346716 RepID=UPI0036A38E84
MTSRENTLRGLALGDSFGQTRFTHKTDDEAPPPWPWTDDTAMALCIHAVLLDHGHIDQDALATAFATEYRRDPHRHYGASMHEVLTAIGNGEPWHTVAGRQFDGQGSWGNGAAMRVAPVGAWFANDLNRVKTEAANSAAVTHAHPEATAGAIAVATATALSITNTPPDRLLPEVTHHTPPSAVRTALQRASRVPFHTDPRSAAGTLGNGSRISAPDTVPFAIWCAARHLDDLEAALRSTASAGGDVDTTCAIVGGIIAGRTGLTKVPTTWLTACEPLPAFTPTGTASHCA